MSSEELPADTMEIELDLAPGMEAEEDTVDRRRINTPDRQNSTIPTGWKPTAAKPIPVVRCTHVWPDGHDRQGERCNKWSLRGSRRCYYHSGRGNLKNVEEYRLAVVESARLRITEAVPEALDWLFELGANSTADNVRLKAATEILDRAGIKSAEQIDVSVTHHEADPAVALAERLNKLKQAADEIRKRDEDRRAAADAVASAAASAGSAVLELEAGDGVVIDGEIVED
jgi:hypothetical protein